MRYSNLDIRRLKNVASGIGMSYNLRGNTLGAPLWSVERTSITTIGLVESVDGSG
jgi:hypothetical protein